MASDARIATGLPAHPKTKKLIRRLGQAAAWNLVCLILWTASNRSDGDLSGMSVEDIELSADWTGEEGQFVATLFAVRFLDGEEGEYRLHDWAEHNPWAAGAESRSAKARWNAAKRHHGIAEADRLVPEYAAIRNAASTAEFDAASNEGSMIASDEQQGGSNAPSPSPSPSPSPTDVSLSPAKLPTCPTQSIVDLYHAELPELPGARLMDDKRKKAIVEFWKWIFKTNRDDGTPRATNSAEALEWVRDYFARATKNDFLMGRTKRSPGHENWTADLDFLMTDRGKKQVIERTQA